MVWSQIWQHVRGPFVMTDTWSQATSLILNLRRYSWTLSLLTTSRWTQTVTTAPDEKASTVTIVLQRRRARWQDQTTTPANLRVERMPARSVLIKEKSRLARIARWSIWMAQTKKREPETAQALCLLRKTLGILMCDPVGATHPSALNPLDLKWLRSNRKRPFQRG